MNNEVKKEKKPILNTILSFILSLFAILSVVFLNIHSYVQGIIFGAQNSDIFIQLIEDELGTKKESIKRQADFDVVEPVTYAVPNEGYVDSLYFNTDLSVDDVKSIMGNLDYISTPFLAAPIYPLLVSDDESIFVFAVKHLADASNPEDDFEINISTDILNHQYERILSTFFLSSTDSIWYTDNVSINKNIVSIFNGLDVGLQNNLLTSLVSTVDYDEYAVPNSGYVDNIYINTSLSVAEVDSILSNSISYVQIIPDNDTTAYLVAANSVFSNGLIIEKFVAGSDLGYRIIIGNFIDSITIYDSYPYSDIGVPGWKVSESSFSFDSDLVNNYQGISIGSQNKSLINLLSVKPYEEESTPVFEKFLSDASDIVLGFITILSTAAISLSDVFIDSSNKLTIVGSAMVLALAVGVIYLLFRMIRGLIKSNIRG